jgi:hypothetical protein
MEKKKFNMKKMIAPIIITVIMLLLYIRPLIELVRSGFSFEGLFWFDIVLIIGVPVGLVGVSLYVLLERIKEIRSGEEDDLSKY